MNSSPRRIFAGITAAAVIIGALWWFAARREPTSPLDTQARTPPLASVEADAPSARSVVAPQEPPLAKNEARPASGTGEAYLDHSFRSFVAAQQGAMGLSAAEVDRLVSVLLEFNEIQSVVIGRFLEETEVTPDTVTVHVPPFPVEGKGVRDLFYQRLKSEFPEKSDRVAAEIGDYVDDVFRGFGIADQTIVVKRGDAPNTFEVSWDARVAPGQTAARDIQAVPYAGSSGVMLFSRDQIVSGEYRFLAPTLSRRFSESK